MCSSLDKCLALTRSRFAQLNSRNTVKETEKSKVGQGSLNQDLSRRLFLRNAPMGTIVALGSSLSLGFGVSSRVLARNPTTPEAAVEELTKGNQRFIAGRLTHNEQDLAILKQHTIEKQEPFAAVLSCSDSRVPVELIFDQSIGHIFVTRIAGNVVTSEVIASIEYAATVLGIKLIFVMGHFGCGAVKAAIKAKEVPGQISALYPHIQPAVDQAGPNLDAAIKANAEIQAALLQKASTVISRLVHEQKLKVIAAYYDLASGKVTLLEQSA